MREMWSTPDAEVLEYLEIVEITSRSVIGELCMRFVVSVFHFE